MQEWGILKRFICTNEIRNSGDYISFSKKNPSMIFYFQENILFRRFSKIPIVPLSVIECIQKLRKKYESGESWVENISKNTYSVYNEKKYIICNTKLVVMSPSQDCWRIFSLAQILTFSVEHKNFISARKIGK